MSAGPELQRSTPMCLHLSTCAPPCHCGVTQRFHDPIWLNFDFSSIYRATEMQKIDKIEIFEIFGTFQAVVRMP